MSSIEETRGFEFVLNEGGWALHEHHRPPSPRLWNCQDSRNNRALRMGASKWEGQAPGQHRSKPLAVASVHFLPVPRLLAATAAALWDSDLSSYSFTFYLTFFLFFHTVCL